MIKIMLFFLCLSTSALAAGKGHGSPADLIPSAGNILILLVGLTFLLKGKLSTFFTDKSQVISEMMERAEIKAKEAELMMNVQRKKIEGAQEEIEELKRDVANQIETFQKEYERDVDERIGNMKTDAGQKIEAERLALLNALNSKLLDQVIVNAKQKIKTEASLQQKATETLVGEL